MTRMTQTMAMLAVAGLAAPAMAGDFGFGFSFGKSGKGKGFSFAFDYGRPAVVAPAPVVVAPPPVVVAPAPVVVTPPPVVVERVWVEPVYKTVTERVWVPTVRTAYRDVPVYDVYGNVVSYRREAYSVQSGYWREVTRQVCVREGYWTTVPATPDRRYPAGESGWGNDRDDADNYGTVMAPQRGERTMRTTDAAHARGVSTAQFVR